MLGTHLYWILFPSHLFHIFTFLSEGTANWTPGSVWSIRWKYSLSLYISASSDVTDVLEEIKQVSFGYPCCSTYYSFCQYNLLRQKPVKNQIF